MVVLHLLLAQEIICEIINIATEVKGIFNLVLSLYRRLRYFLYNGTFKPLVEIVNSNLVILDRDFLNISVMKMWNLRLKCTC